MELLSGTGCKPISSSLPLGAVVVGQYGNYAAAVCTDSSHPCSPPPSLDRQVSAGSHCSSKSPLIYISHDLL